MGNDEQWNLIALKFINEHLNFQTTPKNIIPYLEVSFGEIDQTNKLHKAVKSSILRVLSLENNKTIYSMEVYHAKKKNEITIHSSAAEYLTYVAAAGGNADGMEMRNEDQNIWLTQRMMAQLYDVSIQNIGQHIKIVCEDGEWVQEATIKKFFIV